MTSRTYVAWVGTIPFVKPGANAAYHVMGVEGAKLALGGAGLDCDKLQQASRGYPLGAIGLARCYELTGKLRRTAATTQVEDLHIGLQHDLDLGGDCVVTLYQRA
jgi:hypothetical protein